jgi:HD-like signal output (HDOD) protein
MNEVAPQLEEIASRAVTLYSRPTVAMELMRLADQPSIGASALKDCVAQDPALTCKVLRVVNSSLYGLNRPVADLNQAIGLIGIKPLKLLVLGFNLPDSLFAEVAARELEWYWTNTLTRAVAARLIAEQLWRQSGDEAFIAGLLQDIGILVLLRELGEPYAKFLTGVIEEKCHLASLEQDTLGFDHNQLSAALLSRWQLPERLVEAIAAPKKIARLSRMSSPEGDLPQILHLAEMLMQLVGQRRLCVLSDLLEAGKLYRGMTKSKLAMLVEGLQPQVDQLAESLSLELSEDRDYMQMLVDAHGQMASIGEQIAGESAAAAKDDHAYNELLAHTNDLSDAMKQFLKPGDAPEKEGKRWSGQHAAHNDDKFVREALADQFAECKDNSALVRKLKSAASRCRERRQELSLLLAEPNVFDVH